MLRAFSAETTVSPGHRIEIVSPDLPEGCLVRVFVLLTQMEDAKRPLWEVLSDYPGGEVFPSSKAVDAYLRAEREGWGD